MGKFHTGQSAPSTGTYHFAGHMEMAHVNPQKTKKEYQ